ncbi:MAG TPA: beta-ketoacyl-ACP reductase [Bacteroidetes bacterium]|nr:beta-ketoacyl-ACP reductase [Bacteroidota bacterium]
MTMLGLEGKVIFVSGGNRGIGAAIVNLLEEMGAKVAYNYRSGKGEKGTGYVANVTDPEEMTQLMAQIEQDLGPIYGVVCNAGITRDALATKLTTSDWNEVVDTNLTGVWNTIQPNLAGMYERKEGSVVLVSSIVGERGNIGQINYAATKGAVIAMAKTLAQEGARYKVRANVVAPGFIETDMTKPIPEPVKEKIYAQIPMRRFGKPEEIAWAVVYMLSPVASSFVTGHVLSVNGGHYM